MSPVRSILARCCGCRRCSSGRSGTIPPTPRSRATGCWCAPATSGGPRPAGSRGCRSGGSRTSNVERIVREEMDAAGFQEVHFPALLPREPYEASGRWTEYGDNVFRLKDRRGNDFIMAPTHEEMFTLLVKDLYSSYKDLPLCIYQIQTKYRDEARPRAGLLRGREFVMKDSYSFDLDDAGLAVSYQRHRDAYIRTFDRLGLPYVIVVGDVGGDGRVGERGVPRPARRRRGHVRAHQVGLLRRQRRGGAGHPAARPALRRRPARHRPRHARHADDRHARRPPQRPPRAAPRRSRLDGGRHAQERRRQAAPPRRHHRAARHRRARRPRRRHEAPRGGRRARPRPSRSPTRTSPATRRSPRATSGPARSARRAPPASATSPTRGSSPAPAG